MREGYDKTLPLYMELTLLFERKDKIITNHIASSLNHKKARIRASRDLHNFFRGPQSPGVNGGAVHRQLIRDFYGELLHPNRHQFE
ncbi:MAG: hypothetical protein ACR2PH_10315 [Desulfobulbia bacterium]